MWRMFGNSGSAGEDAAFWRVNMVDRWTVTMSHWVLHNMSR